MVVDVDLVGPVVLGGGAQLRGLDAQRGVLGHQRAAEGQRDRQDAVVGLHGVQVARQLLVDVVGLDPQDATGGQLHRRDQPVR